MGRGGRAAILSNRKVINKILKVLVDCPIKRGFIKLSKIYKLRAIVIKYST
jgi:hypothetical protein